MLSSDLRLRFSGNTAACQERFTEKDPPDVVQDTFQSVWTGIRFVSVFL